MQSNRSPIIYLASESPRRRDILRKLKIRFKKIQSTYHERKIKRPTPVHLVLEHAIGKAKGAQPPKCARFVLAADTIVWLAGHVIGKPKTEREAERTLLALSGKCHLVYTGVVLVDLMCRRQFEEVTVTKVYFRKLKLDEIRRYMKQVNPFDKAGAYAIQEGPKVVRKIVGSYSNVMGLPAETLKRLIQKAIKQ